MRMHLPDDRKRITCSNFPTRTLWDHSFQESESYEPVAKSLCEALVEAFTGSPNRLSQARRACNGEGTHIVIISSTRNASGSRPQSH